MAEKLLEWFEKIVTGEKRRWFFASLIIIVILGIIIFPYIDANFLYYSRIEKRIENLTSLVSLIDTPLEENELLYEEYLSILEEMKIARDNSLFGSKKTNASKYDWNWKFVGGAILWVILSVFLVFNKEKGKKRTIKKWINNFASAIFCLLIGGILGCVFAYLPTIGSVALNFILAPIIQLIVLWLFIGTHKTKSPTEPLKS